MLNFEHLMINDIRKELKLLKVLKVVFGADASAGVINIITKKFTRWNSWKCKFEYGRYNSKIAKQIFHIKKREF